MSCRDDGTLDKSRLTLYDSEYKSLIRIARAMIKESSWRSLEKRVRQIASYIWNASAEPTELHGVKVDAVLRLEDDRWILIEVTENRSLEKLRSDLSKFAAVKPALLAEGIHASCYFVTRSPPTDSLVRTAKGHGVNAMSASQLERRFFDYRRYQFARMSKRFGSAVDPLSGEKDELPYVPVHYAEVVGNQTYSMHDVADALCKQRRIILLGNYGTGKSRCIKEVFTRVAELSSEKNLYPLAIDLREHWGLRRGNEILRRHFDDLGLSETADAAIRVTQSGGVTLLLDGFDEIASQVWSDDPERLKEIRAQSLSGVADLIRSNEGGVLISGREHYFDSQEEMFRCLGLDHDRTLVLSCEEEFSSEQMEEYLRAVRRDLDIPDWLPRRPLVSKMLASFDSADLNVLSEDGGETDFWHRLIDAICVRESRIHQLLDKSTIRSVLLELAHISRTMANDVGPISLHDLNSAFATVVGRPPLDESSAMLQRLPVLGRVDPSSSDRQFVDTYILDGLRATSVAEMTVLGAHREVAHEKWKHPLGVFGQSVLTQHMVDSGHRTGYLQLLRQLANSNNRVLAGDILTALLGIEGFEFDFKNLVLSDSHLGVVNLAETGASNLRIDESFIDELTVGAKRPRGLRLEGCVIRTLRGLSSSDKLPDWLGNSDIERFDALTNVARIREANLSKEEQIFVTVVHKTFFQPGSGRKEDALLRGLGESGDRRIVDRVLSMLLDEGILKTSPGREGKIYVPARKHTRRMARIISQLKYSSDPIWGRLRE